MRRRQLLREYEKARRAEKAAAPSAPEIVRVDWADLSDADIERAFAKRFGRKPHWKMKRETIVERLNDPSD